MRTTAIVIALFLVGSGAITGVHGVAAQTVKRAAPAGIQLAGSHAALLAASQP